MVAFCSPDRYTTNLDSFEDLYTHLTNVDINKYNIDDFLSTKSADLETDGLRRFVRCSGL